MIQALGSTYLEEGNLQSAEPNLLKALQIYRTSFGDSEVVASCFDKLSKLYSKQGRYAAATASTVEAVQIRTKLRLSDPGRFS
jgi:Tfp pilus assembly protein PilF